MLNKAFASPQSTEPAPRLADDRPGRTAGAVAAPSSVLDADALAKLRELDPTGVNCFVVRILATYQRSVASLGGKLREARRDGDTDAIRRIVHTLKSSSAHVGALALAKICDGIEKEIVGNSGADLNADLDAVIRELAVALSAVAERLGATS